MKKDIKDISLDELCDFIADLFNSRVPEKEDRNIISFRGCKTYGTINMFEFCENTDCTSCTNYKKLFYNTLEHELASADYLNADIKEFYGEEE